MNHIAIEKTGLFAHESVYWIHMNTDLEDTLKNCPTYLDFQATQHRGKTVDTKYQGGYGICWS